MSAISEVASFWFEGAMRTIDAFRNGFGTSMDDPEPATPSRVIYEAGLVRLRHYAARGDTRHRVPLLLIYSLIKRPFILDLRRGRSVIEHLVNQRKLFEVTPDRLGFRRKPEDKWRGFDAYV